MDVKHGLFEERSYKKHMENVNIRWRAPSIYRITFSLIIPPEKLTDKNPQIEISTIHRSRGRMGRVDSGDVKNSVLPRWRSAAIKYIESDPGPILS